MDEKVNKLRTRPPVPPVSMLESKRTAKKSGAPQAEINIETGGAGAVHYFFTFSSTYGSNLSWHLRSSKNMFNPD